MEKSKIENISYFNIGAVLNAIALLFLFLPEEYEQVLFALGSKWGYWWYYLVDSASIVFLLLGTAAMTKAFNYKGPIWPSSKDYD